MVKPKGGRGKKAPYSTVQMRVPLPIKSDVERLIDSYRHIALSQPEVSNSSVVSSDNDDALLALKLLADFIEIKSISGKMHTRDNTNLKRFKEWLELKVDKT